jgi:peptidoglycan/LPS O-acetylase OafA/YrhL
MSKQPVAADRIYSLDVLRGVAALSVVFWHWQHFFYVGGQPHNFTIWKQPVFSALSFFYMHGSLAVELFFCISGFVFTWLFSKQIAARTITPSRFFIDRVSRLYPLHIATFLMVALLQYLFTRHHDSFFVYQTNDLYHAVLNLFLMPAWGFEKGWSFNAPVWSVSVEALLYGAFFVVCLTRNLRYLLIPCLIALGAYIYPSQYKLGSGIFTFFCGGAAYFVLDYMARYVSMKSIAFTALVFTIAAWAYIWQSPTMNIYFLMGIAYPLSVMTFAAIGFEYTNFMKPFAAIGDISYSSYLLHFPLQLCFAMTVDHLGYDRDIFYNSWMLALFMAILIALSFASHRLFEVPAQRAIRSAFRKRSEMKGLPVQ